MATALVDQDRGTGRDPAADDEDETRTRQAHRDGLDRLANVKAIYDPDNLFRVNRNISPAV